MAKITAISDTHTMHYNMHVGSGDILIHAGDATGMGYEHEIRDFIEWYHKQDYEHKIYVPGNHDIGLERCWEERSKWFTDAGIIILKDESVVLKGVSIDDFEEYSIKIHGSPYTPNFGRWAFMRARGEQIKAHWHMIPEDTDVLVTHGPPYGILDEVETFGSPNIGQHVGCEMLWERIQQVNPKLHIFGHIHEGAGTLKLGNTEFINASQLNEFYNLVHTPIERVM